MAFSWNGESQDNFDVYVKLVTRRPASADDRPRARRVPRGRPTGRRSPSGGRSTTRSAIVVVPAMGGRGASARRGFLQCPLLLVTGRRSPFRVALRSSRRRLRGLALLSIGTGQVRRLTSFLPLLGRRPAARRSPRRTDARLHPLPYTVDSEIYLLAADAGTSTRRASRADSRSRSRARASPSVPRTARAVVFGRWPRIELDPGLMIIPVRPPARRRGGPGAEKGGTRRPSRRREARLRSLARDENVWRLPPRTAAGRPRPSSSPPVGKSIPSSPPDGTKITFASDRSGTHEIWTCANADGTGMAQLPSLTRRGRPVRGHDGLPDGRTIVFVYNVEGQMEIT